jgi:ParB/RepB/Spo0J family partition protein
MPTTHDGVIVLGGGLAAIPVGLIDPGENWRGTITNSDVVGLATSMKAVGQLEPIAVEQTTGGRYRIREGHRRHLAAHLNQTPRLLAFIRKPAGRGERAIEQLAIHGNRTAFDPVADADAIHYLMFTHEPPMSRDQIAQLVGRTEQWVADRVALLNLTAAERDALRAHDLTLGEAKDIVTTRRAERDERHVPTPRTASRPAKRRSRPVDHFGPTHRLAAAAAAYCAHPDRTRLGAVACGPCWEDIIRADVAAPVLAA